MAGKVQQNEETVNSSASDEQLHSRLSAGELFLEIATLHEIPYCFVALKL